MGLVWPSSLTRQGLSGEETGPAGIDSPTVGSSRFDLLRICIAGLISVVLLAILAVDVLGGHDHSAAHPSNSGGEVLALTEYELLSRAGTIEPTAYWVGRRPGADHFELEKDSEGNVYIRYWTGNSSSGGHRADSLTVASYPVGDAQSRLERAAKSEGREVLRRDGFVALDSDDSRSAYVVFKSQPELQIEIYSPRPGQAARLLTAGAVTPLHWTPLE